jgi:predicted nucleic acid-binding protein
MTHQRSSRHLLFDANSLLLVIRSEEEARSASIIEDSNILDLTTYEIGNSVWNELELLKFLSAEESKSLKENIGSVLSRMQKLFVGPIEFSEVLEIARAEKKTFYDSSYIYVAKRDNLTLVTEDRKLFKTAEKYVPAKSVHELLVKDGT